MRRSSFFATVLLGCLLTVPVRAQLTLNTELLTNPGAETGDLTGWIKIPASTAQPSVDDGSYDSGLNPLSGSWQFVGDTYPAGGGAFAGLEQSVDLSGLDNAVLAAIDAGAVLARVSYWEQSLYQGGTPDYARVTLTYRDAFGSALGSDATPAQAHASASFTAAWTRDLERFSLPAGTRSISYTMEFYLGANAGTYIDAFIDDNSLILVSAVPEPASSAVLYGLVLLAIAGPVRRAHRPLGEDARRRNPV